MSWLRAYNGVRDKLAQDDLSLVSLETLARQIPLDETDEHRGIVGSAIESVLRDRYEIGWELWADAVVFAAGYAFPGEEYRDRVDRAKADAMHRILDGRHGDPFETFAHADNASEAPAGAWREHCRTFYGVGA